jgi:hypothetical protein
MSQSGTAKELPFQTGHTHDILSVKFSPDDSKLVSYSAGDGWLCYWDVKTGQLLWKSKTGFIRKAAERWNLEDFGWNGDQSLIYSRSQNGTFQTWDAKSGRILSLSETIPAEKVFTESTKRISVTKDYSSFCLTNSETNEKSTIKAFSRTASVYDVSHDGRLFAEGGDWGNAIIRVTKIGDPKISYDMRGGRIPPYVQNELETRLLEQQRLRDAELRGAKALRYKPAAVETEGFRKQVYVSFDHYGEMTDPGEQRMIESGDPNKSKVRKSLEDAKAIWLRLNNDSPLPIRIPTQSMYLPNPRCFFQFPSGKKTLGLCDNREISIRFGLEDKNGRSIPYGFDFGSTAILLPKTFVLFAVPRAVLQNGKAIRFGFTFQEEPDYTGSGDYGASKVLRFRETDLPKSH